MYAVLSKGIFKIPFISKLTGRSVCLIRPWRSRPSKLDAVLGWGLRPSTRKARAYAKANQLPFISLEDGFLRSYGTSAYGPPLSIVQDEVNVYYDATQASALENALNAQGDLTGFDADNCRLAKALIIEHHLSKYNHAPMIDVEQYRLSSTLKKILVIDQTFGDMSVVYGAAHEHTFETMLQAARLEHPEAIIYIKTHPEVSSGQKSGYLTHIKNDAHTVVIRSPVNPLSLIKQVDHVYVVTSTMGFEALLAGKPVSVFGQPWYAGWGVTDDRIACVRRNRKRNIDELFHAAYFQYARYLNPVTHNQGNVFDVIDWLQLQKKIERRFSGRMICVGFRRWKAANIKPMLSLSPNKVIFVKNTKEAERHQPVGDDCLIHWGNTAPEGLLALSQRAGVRLLRMEDGFVRSVGLGSDLIRPQSLVLDESGLYFDPTRASDLEKILNQTVFLQHMLTRAENVRQYIVEHGITKYNTESREQAQWFIPSNRTNTKVILVVGQVEDDASIIFGCTHVKTNLGLLKATRAQEPNAFIVYKPHPDVMSGNRQGRIALNEVEGIADCIETHLSIVSCIEACDELYTMTSLSGFDALLRGKKVIVFGKPFYAGWGLTQDALEMPRRERKLSLNELIAGTLLEYPLYWDWSLKGYTTCEATLRRIVEERDSLEAAGQLHRLKTSYVRRQIRKCKVLFRGLTHKTHL